MIRLQSPVSQRYLQWMIMGILAAIGIGLLALTQPIAIVVIVGVVVACLVLATIHPIAVLIPLLILAPMRVLISTEAVFQLPLDIGQIALVIFFAAWGVQRITRTNSSPMSLADLWTPLSGALLLFIAATGLSAFVATSLTAWALEWVKWVLLFAVFTTVVIVFSTISWEWLIFALVLSGVANALVGIYEFFGGSGALHLLINDRFFRAFGTFGQPNPFGGFMGLLIPLSIMSAVGYALRWHRSSASQKSINLLQTVFYIFASVILLVAIGMSWSRGAWLGLGAALLIMGFFIPRKLRVGLFLFIVIIGMGLIVWFSGLLPQSIVQRLQTSTEEFFAFEDVRGVDITPDNFAIAERLAHWQAAINMLTAHPVLGVGFGNYAASYPDYQLINWSEPLGHAHNYYLNIFAEVGIIGLLVYGKVWVTIFHRTWQATSHPDTLTRLVIIGLLGAWVYLSVHSFFDNLYVNNLFLHLAVMISIVIVVLKEVKTNVRI